MKLGNVVTNDNVKFDETLNIFKNLDDVDNDLPTLIVGWKKTHTLYPEQSILKNVISENLHWCASKFEDVNSFNIGVEKFLTHCFNEYSLNFTYYNVDFVNISLSNMKKIISKIKRNLDAVIYYDENDIYILTDKIIFNLNIPTMLFINVDVDKLKSKLSIMFKTILPNKKSTELYNKINDRIYEDKSLLLPYYLIY